MRGLVAVLAAIGGLQTVPSPLLGKVVAALEGSSDSVGASSPASNWVFAEGHAGNGFTEILTLLNPASTGVTVDALYEFPPPAKPLARSYSVEAGKRTEIKVNDEVGKADDVGVVLRATGPIVAERRLYFGFDPGAGEVRGGDVAPGVALNQSWYFAEGYTGGGFHEYLAALNPQAAPASVTVTYQFPGGRSQGQELTVPPTSRATVDVNAVVGPNREVATQVSSDQAIAVERPMYFDACVSGLCTNGGDVAGGSQPVTSADFAEGYTGKGFQEYLTLLNPNLSSANVTVTYMLADGSSQVRSLSVSPGSRQTLDTNAVVGGGREVSMRVRSDLPVVVERPMYYNACVPQLCSKGGAVASGQQPAPSWYFADGSTGSGVHEYLVLENPNSDPTSVSINYRLGDGQRAQTLNVGGGSRATVDVNAAVGAERQVALAVSADQPVVVERPLYFQSPGESPAASEPAPAAPAAQPDLARSVQQRLINQDRTAAGLPALAWSGCLRDDADRSARRMAAQGYISHANGANEALACELGSSQGGENVGYYTAGIDDNVLNDAFMKSSDHRANILGPYRYVGTAWRVDGRGWGFVAVEFA